jgi:short subunit dehydrogenase-like uncharacterized protein
MSDPLLVYGATGYTGKLVTLEARARGLSPILGGRSEAKLHDLSSSLALESRTASLDDPRQLARALEGTRVVLNTAGPFSATASALADACLHAGVHYLDVTGEVGIIGALAGRDGEARRQRIMVMPAVGFDVVPSECLALHVARRSRCPGKRLFIGISMPPLLSRGSIRTIIEQIGGPVLVRRGGSLQRVPPVSLERSFDYGSGPSPSLVVSWGDVASAYFSTGIPDITVYFEATAAVRTHGTLRRLFDWAVPFTPWRASLDAAADWVPDGPTEDERARHRAVIVAEVEDEGGESHRARLRTPDTYSFSAACATAIAIRVLAGDFEPGFQTPARVYGPDFVLGFAGVSREDF